MMNNITEIISYVPCNPENHGGTRSAKDIRYLVFHYTGNDGDKAANNAYYYRDNVVESSAHYFVDDTHVIQSVGDFTVAWAVGGKKWKDCSQTGGGKLHGIVTNTNSLSIEMCDTLHDGTHNVSLATERNAIALGKLLMERYNIPIERVVRHFDVTGKYCPAYLMDEQKWAQFKAQLVETGDKEVKRYNKVDEMPSYAQATINKLIDKKLLAGKGVLKDNKNRPADLDLSEDMVRLLVINDRAGVYGV